MRLRDVGFQDQHNLVHLAEAGGSRIEIHKFKAEVVGAGRAAEVFSHARCVVHWAVVPDARGWGDELSRPVDARVELLVFEGWDGRGRWWRGERRRCVRS